MAKCDHICSECGKHESGGYFEEVVKQLVERQFCFSCDYWHGKINKTANNADAWRIVRVDHVHYMIGDPLPPGRDRWWAGFGGAPFRIRFQDGREMETRNLWCQGKIPEHFHDRLPDNAVFLLDEAAHGGAVGTGPDGPAAGASDPAREEQ